MGKKIAIVVAVAAIGGVIFMPEITAFSARKAFHKENVEQPWAPRTAYRAGKINLRFFRFNSGAKILERFVTTFPKDKMVPDAHFQIAMCHEKRGRTEKALQWYGKFIERFPKHRWYDQARKRVENIKAGAD